MKSVHLQEIRHYDGNKTRSIIRSCHPQSAFFIIFSQSTIHSKEASITLIRVTLVLPLILYSANRTIFKDTKTLDLTHPEFHSCFIVIQIFGSVSHCLNAFSQVFSDKFYHPRKKMRPSKHKAHKMLEKKMDSFPRTNCSFPPTNWALSGKQGDKFLGNIE